MGLANVVKGNLGPLTVPLYLGSAKICVFCLQVREELSKCLWMVQAR